VRTRFAHGQEGSDFARIRRQQEVLVAIKEQLVSVRMVVSPKRLLSLVGALKNSTDTDMNIGELLTIGKIIASVRQEAIMRIALDDHFSAPPIFWYGRYVLVPKESFEAIHAFVRNSLRSPAQRR